MTIDCDGRTATSASISFPLRSRARVYVNAFIIHGVGFENVAGIASVAPSAPHFAASLIAQAQARRYRFSETSDRKASAHAPVTSQMSEITFRGRAIPGTVAPRPSPLPRHAPDMKNPPPSQTRGSRCGASARVDTKVIAHLHDCDKQSVAGKHGKTFDRRALDRTGRHRTGEIRSPGTHTRQRRGDGPRVAYQAAAGRRSPGSLPGSGGETVPGKPHQAAAERRYPGSLTRQRRREGGTGTGPRKRGPAEGGALHMWGKSPVR